LLAVRRMFSLLHYLSILAQFFPFVKGILLKFFCFIPAKSG